MLAQLGITLGLTSRHRCAGATSSACEVTRVVCVADVAANKHGKYFLIPDGYGLVAVQLVEEASPPPPPGWGAEASRPIYVSYSAGSSAAQMASLVHAALVNDGAWTSVSIASNIFSVADVSIGARTDASDVDTGFTISTTTQGA